MPAGQPARHTVLASAATRSPAGEGQHGRGNRTRVSGTGHMALPAAAEARAITGHGTPVIRGTAGQCSAAAPPLDSGGPAAAEGADSPRQAQVPGASGPPSTPGHGPVRRHEPRPHRPPAGRRGSITPCVAAAVDTVQQPGTRFHPAPWPRGDLAPGMMNLLATEGQSVPFPAARAAKATRPGRLRRDRHSRKGRSRCHRMGIISWRECGRTTRRWSTTGWTGRDGSHLDLRP